MMALCRALKNEISTLQKKKAKNPLPLDKVGKVTMPETAFAQSFQKCKNSSARSARALGVPSGHHIQDKYAVIFL